MRFASPEYLYLLLLLPVVLLIFIYAGYRRKKNIESYGDPQLVKALIPSTASLRNRVSFWLLFAALALTVLVLARPQFGTKKEVVTTRGVEVVVALDISNSMLADDIYPNRLEKAKRLISRIINRSGENKVALVVFAGDAFVQLPITDDFISAKMFLESITPELIARQGTDIGAAINLAAKSFTSNEKIGKAIIIITDGENHEGGAEEAAALVAEKGINVFVLGVGTEKGGRIPLNGKNDYMRDGEGFVVVSKLNEEMAGNIAKAGKGTYVRVDNTNNAQTIIENELDKLQKDDVKTEIYSKYREQFEAIAVIVLLLLVAEIVTIVIIDSLQGKRNGRARR
ncbi:MAG: VWA domain-containing protein [Bacteroidaceae bacterium]|nr:VWA domain-containing protein [Bacteroidaceae bacterium]